MFLNLLRILFEQNIIGYCEVSKICEVMWVFVFTGGICEACSNICQTKRLTEQKDPLLTTDLA